MFRLTCNLAIFLQVRDVGTFTHQVNCYSLEGGLWVVRFGSRQSAGSPAIFFLIFDPANTLSFNKHLLL